VRAKFYENSKRNNHENWRKELQLKALGAITYAGGAMTGHDLGQLLRISPKALRNLLIRPNLCNVLYSKRAAIYTVKTAFIPASPLLLIYSE
jgi:hypothetical protein